MRRALQVCKSTLVRVILAATVVSALPATAQTFPFTSGPIPPCDTSTFTATVSGVGFLIVPDGWSWGSYLESVLINITSDHPQTLQVSLTSPEGTTLLLSAFNGAGGQNYTNTNFTRWAWNNINNGSAPFTGDFLPEVGSLDDFAGEYGDGTWTITVIDTACANGGTGPGGNWTPGWFSGGAGSGAFAFGFSSPPPPCFYDMGWQQAYVCPGGAVDIITYFNNNWGGWGGVTFNVWEMWTGAPVADPTNVSAPGSYQIEGYDWSGCTYIGSYEVVSVPGVSLGPDQSLSQCSAAGPVDLTALFNTSGASVVTWTLDGTSITTAAAMAATTAGTYEVSAANQGCLDVAQATLTIGNTPVLGPDQSVSICEGASTDLTALVPGSTSAGEWSVAGSVVTPPTVAASTAVYAYSITTNDGCTDTVAVALNVQAVPVLGADANVAICDGSDTDLTVLYNTTGLTTAWTLNSVSVVDPTAVADAGTYMLVASDALGCQASADVIVDLLPAPALGADAVASICTGEVADLTTYFDVTGLSATWTQGGAPVADATAIGTAGLYTLSVTDANGCTDVANVTLAVAATPVLGNDAQVTICDGATLDLGPLFNTAGTTTSWTLNGSAVADPGAVSTGGDYILTVTNGAGCSASATATVTVQPAPSLGADQVASVCAGAVFDLTTLYDTGGLTSEWTFGGVPVADPNAITTAGTYELTVSNAGGCADEALVLFSVNTPPSLGDDLFFSLCPWQTVDLGTVFPTAGMTAAYTWNGTVIADGSAVSDSGTYVVTVIDVNGCTDEAQAFVVEAECMCVADFVHDARCLQEKAHFTLLADSAIVSARWSFGGMAAEALDIDPLVEFVNAGDVPVVLEATLTCGVVRVERMITVQDCSDSCSVWVPSSFTPNGDTFNDAWTWRGECVPEDYAAAVFDRWGEIMFSSNDPAEAWDGSYGGGQAPPGVYVYRVDYRLPYQKGKVAVGSITLVR